MSDLLVNLEEEATRAASAVPSEEENACRAIHRDALKGVDALAKLLDLVWLKDAEDGGAEEADALAEGWRGAVVGLTGLVHALAMPEPFDRSKGDSLVSAINMVKDIPGMIDPDECKRVVGLWADAAAQLPKVGKSSASGGSGAGSKGSRPKVDFVLWYRSTDGTMKRNRPAEVAQATQVNEARYVFGFKKDAQAVTDALTQILSGETGEVVVPEVGKFYREALAG